jgi:hypothetical protein
MQATDEGGIYLRPRARCPFGERMRRRGACGERIRRRDASPAGVEALGNRSVGYGRCAVNPVGAHLPSAVDTAPAAISARAPGSVEATCHSCCVQAAVHPEL